MRWCREGEDQFVAGHGPGEDVEERVVRHRELDGGWVHVEGEVRGEGRWRGAVGRVKGRGGGQGPDICFKVYIEDGSDGEEAFEESEVVAGHGVGVCKGVVRSVVGLEGVGVIGVSCGRRGSFW